jgi:hypothetical protein
VLALASKKKTEKNSPSITKKTKVSERTNDMTKLEELKAAYEAAAAKAEKATYVAKAAETVAKAAEEAAGDCWEAADELWVAYKAERKIQEENPDDH